MTTLKVYFTILFISLFIIDSGISIAGTETGNKSSELNSQIIQEIKEVLKTPYLKYESKNLTGLVKVVSTVNNNGRIIFKNIEGINSNLVSNVISKLNSLNLWTGTDYSGKEFVYTIKYKD